MMPACSHTGTPLHFHSSTTSGSACLMRLRTRASVSPRQSPSSLILVSISREGVPSFEPLLLFFMVIAFLIVEADIRMSLERVDISKRRVLHTSDRTSVVQKLADIDAAAPHALKPCSR